MQKSFIIIKGRACAVRIKSISQDSRGYYAVQYDSKDTVFHYAQKDVIILKDAKYYNPASCDVYVDGKHKHNIAEILAFTQKDKINWRITYGNGFVRDFLHSENIEVKENCLADERVLNVFQYLRDVASANQLGKDQESFGILTTQYNRIGFIDKTLAIAPYLFPQEVKPESRFAPGLIYPFGCNASQKKAVKEAFSNQLSVIQGPPGTGKTQTILNIIANIIMQGKTVLVVSNNNSATANVKEKLEKYDMGFIVASLGKRDNKELFILNQPEVPDIVATWMCEERNRNQTGLVINQTISRLDQVFKQQEKLATLKLELQSLELEWEHFKADQKITISSVRPTLESSSTIMSMWMEFQAVADKDEEIAKNFIKKLFEELSWWWKSRKIRKLLQVKKIDRNNLWPTIIELQKLYYQTKISEVKKEIEDIKNNPATANAEELLQKLTDDSMCLFKDKLCQKYGNMKPLVLDEVKEIGKHSEEFCIRYPVVLSTTFSARTSVPDFVYDYIIMDEASQVSVETGALALTCARNAVIVGDSLQLPNVITREDKALLNSIYDHYKVDDGYNSAEHSFLDSVCKIIPDVKQTLLREHYRCHPRIINFCNQKFYGGELLIMTEDNNEKDVLSAIKTVPGYHSRDHYNQREIDVIQQEVLPNIPEGSDIGIISPYNAQVDAINSQLGGMAATVHKYQGREKDTIIFSVVDDEITDFSDDPNLLNVAISRAKKNFCLVVTGNKQNKSGNITALIDYIEYNNCSVTQSKIHSIFDYLYGAYTKQRMKFLANSEKISEYDSENLTYALLKEIIGEHDEFGELGILCHYPLRMLISDTSAMTDEERLFASRQGTHLDFLIYSHVTKKPVLAIETDGYTYHNDQTLQHQRDLLKNSILEKYGIRLLRLSTVGSGEEERIIDALNFS